MGWFTRLALTALAFGASLVSGHGVMVIPASRNRVANVAGKDDTPHGNNALPPCGGRPGVTNYNGSPGRVTATYGQGAVIDIQLTVSAQHAGVWTFGLCTQSSPTQSCFDANLLTNVGSGHGSGTKYYFIGTDAKEGTFNLKFKLPPTISCKSCVLQWHWITGNSCTPSMVPAAFAKSALGTCTAGSVQPEEFWNCADVSIGGTGSGGSAGSNTNTKTPPAKAKATTKTAQVKASNTGNTAALPSTTTTTTTVSQPNAITGSPWLFPGLSSAAVSGLVSGAMVGIQASPMAGFLAGFGVATVLASGVITAALAFNHGKNGYLGYDEDGAENETYLVLPVRKSRTRPLGPHRKVRVRAKHVPFPRQLEY